MNNAAWNLVVAPLSLPSAFAADPSLRVDYEGFPVWLNCQENVVVKFRYNAQRDSDNFPSSSTFRFDQAVPYEGLPSGTNFLKTDASGALPYASGHQVPANNLGNMVGPIHLLITHTRFAINYM